MRKHYIILFFTLQVLLSGCLNRGDSEVSGKLIVWHNYRPDELPLLQDILDRFMETYPGVTVIPEFMPNAEYSYDPITKEGGLFVERTAAGVGPDMLIGLEHTFYRSLIDSDLIEPIDETEIDLSRLDQRAVDACRKDGKLWTVPFSGYVTVLFYNTDLTEAPPRTLLELLEETEQDKKLLYPLTAVNSLWHTSYTVEELVNSKGQITSSVEDWVSWFKQLRALVDRANVILDSDYETLLNSFAEGNAAYFIGSSFDLPILKTKLGDKVRIASLPVLTRVPSAYMNVRTIALVKHSRESKAAKTLLEYMINESQQSRLAQRDFGRVPMNTTVKLDARILPNLGAIANESKHAVIFPVSVPTIGQFERDMDDIERDFLEGLISPEVAGERLYASLQTNLASSGQNQEPQEGQ